MFDVGATLTVTELVLVGVIANQTSSSYRVDWYGLVQLLFDPLLNGISGEGGVALIVEQSVGVQLPLVFIVNVGGSGVQAKSLLQIGD